MENITKNLDTLYFRNRATIANSARCTPYKTIKTYSTCFEDEIEKTVAPSRNDFVRVKPNGEKVTVPTPTPAKEEKVVGI